jgi:ABC-2 type transport system ATP-binding protein
MSAPPAIRTTGLRKVYRAPKVRRPIPGGGIAGSGGGTIAPATTGPAGGTGGDIVALEGLDLAVGAGEFFGLLGPNGAGKTTTISILTTRGIPTAGQAVVAGADVVREAVAVRQRIGVVPQRPNPDRSLTARENLVFHASYFGIPRAVAAARADALLGTFGIADRGGAKVDQLSGGQQQRLMIARALMHDPEVLFLDEPTVGLDPQARLAVWDILRGLHERGHTIVLTTHYMEEADRLCERLAILDQGRLLALDTPANLKARAPGGTLVEIMLDGDAAAATDLARAVPGVLKAEAHKSLLRAYAERPGETISGLIRAAEQAGRAVLNIHLASPSLETLFISLTGRGLE